jgi:hypothetical protein
MAETQRIPIRIGGVLAGVAVSSDANLLHFHASKAFPPGQPLEITLWPDTPQAFTVQARSIGSRLQDDQTFAVRARLVNLGREARAQLLRAFGERD